MIDITYFAQTVENLLNGEILSQIAQGNEILNTDRVTYRFKVMLDGGEFKDFDYLNYGMAPESIGAISQEQTNKIVRYINCELDITGSKSDGVQSVEMAIQSRLEVMIPLTNAGKKKARLELVNTIRQVIDNAFRLNSSGTIPDAESGITYNFGIIYQIADTGDRDKRQEIGDSVTLTAFLSFFVVQEGVNSSSYELYIDGIRVPFTRLGFNRGAQLESNLPSDSPNGAGKNTPTSTVFGLNFDMPTRKGALGELLSDFLYGGQSLAHFVQVVDAVTGGAPYQYLMLFQDVSNNAETTKFASCSVTMAEALKEGNTLSAYAQEYWRD